MDLNNLRKAMKKTTFKGLEFTENHRQAVQQKIEQFVSVEDLRQVVLQLLTQQKTGYELTQLLHVRTIKGLENNEGALYVLLHQLEQEGQIYANWSDQGEKFYVLSDKGKKSLVQDSPKNLAWRSIVQGWGS